MARKRSSSSTSSSWIVALVVVLLVFLGSSAVVIESAMSERDRIRRALRDASASYGLDPDYLDAICYVESRWRMNVTNMSGNDGGRGGAWGPTQITETTARAFGYAGDMAALLSDPDLAASLSAQILSAGNPADFAEAVAVWNAGRYGADRNGNGILDPGEAPASTVNTYWPAALEALAVVQSTPVPES